MNARKLQEQRRANLTWTVAILGALLTMLAALGWLVAGWAGLMWAILLGAASLALKQTAGSAFLRQYLGAEPIPFWLAPDLHGVTRELARRAGLVHVPRLHYLPTRVVQALATGSERDAAIGLSDGLLRLLSRRELTAVIAHELWHIRQRDLAVMRLAAAAAQLTQALCFAGFALGFLYLLPAVVSDEAPADIAWRVFPLLGIAPTVSTLLWLALARTREFDADVGAAALTGDPEALASALRRLELAAGRHWEMLSRSAAPAWLSRWISTHPPAAARIKRLLELAPPRPARMPLGRLRVWISPDRPDRLGRGFV
jgi:heat shock protein HtpX